MGKHAVVVVGPAGAGKSTMCRTLYDHYSALGKSTHVCNFDPAAEDLQYDPSLDVRELINVGDAMEAKGLGPNGGLVFCMEYLMANATWLHDALADYADDFLIVDMPGQIELLSHVPVVPSFVEALQREGYFVTALFLLDAPTATSDPAKFISGCLLTLTTMTAIECPFINVLSKCDMLPKEMREGRDMEIFEGCEFDYLDLQPLPSSMRRLTQRVASIVHDFALVKFVAVDITDTDIVGALASMLNDTLQVDDDAEVNDAPDEEPEEAS